MNKEAKFPGACSPDYQAAMQVVCVLLGWALKKLKQRVQHVWKV
jgi:hypothetical protein